MSESRLPLRSKLLLASASPRRAGILARAGLDFAVAPSNIDEDDPRLPGPPEELAVRLATLKAESVAAKRGEAGIVLGADTLVVLDGTVLGKPRDEDEARRMLRSLRDRTHQVVTGVALAGELGRVSGREVTEVHIRDYTEEEIERYVRSGSPLDKAGSYGIQDRPFSPARRVVGCYLNVVGLPLCRTLELFRQVGAIPESVRPVLHCGDHGGTGASS